LDDSHKNYEGYLAFVNKYKSSLGYKGNYSKNEIEIVDDISLFPTCEESAVGQMVKQGTPREDAVKRARIGIREENRWGVSICEPVKLPTGTYGTFIRFISWGQLDSGFAGMIIIPVLTDGKLIFTKAFRNATRNWCLEFPRGTRDPGDSILKTLNSELKEEVGAKVLKDPVKIGEVFPDSGILTSIVEIYKAEIEIVGEATPGVTEAIKGLVFLTPEEVKALLKSQLYIDEDGKGYEFKDSFTLVALTLFNIR